MTAQTEGPMPRAAATVSIQTHGCKLNQADSEELARRFIRAGCIVVGSSEPADIYVINTCTVTHVADAKARQSMRAAKRRNPDALVVATGCYAQRAPGQVSGVEGVGLVAGNSEKERLVEMVMAARYGGAQAPAPAGLDAPAPPNLRGVARTRAMVKIQEGCNQICAYCIVPKVRGRERSIPPEELVAQVTKRVGEGYKEVVLTGTQLGSYGFDLEGTSLASLLRRLLEETGIERLRVSSLQPQEITSEILGLWHDGRLCPHFHMPLQSGSDGVLKRMRRRYTTGQYADAADRVRSRLPAASITTDVIVGFPGESELRFREGLRFVESMDFAGLHVFPYSTRPGTSAAYMGPAVDEPAKRGRMEAMLELAGARAAAFRRRSIGDTRPVLWERSRVLDGKRVCLGLTDNYLRVQTEGDHSLLNRITPALLTGELGESMVAEVPAKST